MKDSSFPSPKEKIEELGQRVDRLRHALLDPDTLRRLLPIRARLLPQRSMKPDARAREARFRAASPAYERALADINAFAGQTRVIELDTLTWWVPILNPDDEADVQRYVAGQDFPYRVITQTREVAIGGLMLDLGGNNGRMAVPRAILGDVTAVYCAEPDPLNYMCLVRNVSDNHLAGLVLPDWVAIGSESGTARLERARTAGGHRVINDGRVSKGETIDVPVFTLDAWVERLEIDLQDVSFVKVDVQGSELHVLRGASRVLASRHIPWQMEIDPPLLARRGVDLDELYGTLAEHFTHFVDLNKQVATARVQPTSEMASRLGYIAGRSDGRTDVLLFSLE